MSCPLADMGFTYRHCSVPDDWIFTEAMFQGTAGDPAEILKEMDEVADYREKNQPIKERTGGSTFKNPPGYSAWKLIDEAGCRGLRVGGAKVSEMHCNFLINDRKRRAKTSRRSARRCARASKLSQASGSIGKSSASECQTPDVPLAKHSRPKAPILVPTSPEDLNNRNET